MRSKRFLGRKAGSKIVAVDNLQEYVIVHCSCGSTYKMKASSLRYQVTHNHKCRLCMHDSRTGLTNSKALEILRSSEEKEV